MRKYVLVGTVKEFKEYLQQEMRKAHAGKQ
ncbi:hypothetical protein SAMN05446037_1002105 [Anaerovirgula multivorans]|uniref:Uncharacterized protein n=1 Tax=Anaerovirgula multivorans TaxID=312168 RepID=A0A239AK43_9FIRM|nr:hypothetical protein SAMN05446037_1002105 [Anaerovirgula multivorans]